MEQKGKAIREADLAATLCYGFEAGRIYPQSALNVYSRRHQIQNYWRSSAASKPLYGINYDTNKGHKA